MKLIVTLVVLHIFLYGTYIYDTYVTYFKEPKE